MVGTILRSIFRSSFFSSAVPGTYLYRQGSLVGSSVGTYAAAKAIT